MEEFKELPSYLKIVKIFELMNEGSDESLEIIMNFAGNDTCPLVRHEAVFALGEMAAPMVAEFLKNLVKEDESYVVRHEALVSLGTIGKREDLEFLEKYFDDPILEVSNSAKVGYERLSREESLEGKVKDNLDYYISRLKESSVNQNEKIQILFQLMLEGSEQSVDAISWSLINDFSSVVRHEAGFVLGEIGTERCVELMGKALENEESSIVLHETLFGLGTSGKMSALPFIEKFLSNEDYVVSESAKIAKDRLLNLKNPYSGARHFS